MKQIKSFLIIILILLFIPITILFIDYINSNHIFQETSTFKNDLSEEIEKTSTKETIDQPSDNNTKTHTINDSSTKEPQNKPLKHSAWIPHWGFSNGIKSLKESPNKFEIIMPVLYEVNSNGTLKKHKPSQLNELKEICQEEEIKLIPSIAMFDWRLMESIYSNEQYFQTHISEITKILENPDYDGLDLDYESIQLTDKDKFYEMLNEISLQSQKHNKILSITILPKWENGEPYSYLPETREVQDYSKINKYADQIRIMTYDYTSATSTKPGPLAPIQWMNLVLDYAINQEEIPPEKLWLGVHLYGYKWQIKYSPGGTTPIEQRKATPLVYPQILDIAEKEGFDSKTMHDSFLDEGFIEYQSGEDNWTYIYFQTPQGIKAREKLTQKYNIQGLAYWRLGREGELL